MAFSFSDKQRRLHIDAASHWTLDTLTARGMGRQICVLVGRGIPYRTKNLRYRAGALALQEWRIEAGGLIRHVRFITFHCLSVFACTLQVKRACEITSQMFFTLFPVLRN